ncbi:hypothetical protein LOTGIDRAFT_167841 [Lottia gigantea]|uniref:Uncharacterized protein n=1 Tax=Lottia gigantea TaxID=225164 RepID=V3ZLT0_LOTGI|nr:hypothetical protein LOTGIDRAFT_167841 [Lottia gigantea]ESO85267.1 hypothetical protein LOTGIDRAFT_167841 [Lottia gigantea]
MVDLQCRSMKNNLIFNGIHEERDEDTEYKIRDFIYNILRIDQKIEFGNVHRFGKVKAGKQRPIVARFIYYRDLTLVKRNGYRLEGTKYGINEQFPAVIEPYPVIRDLKAKGHKTKLVRNKLFVDNELYDSLRHQSHEQPQKQDRPIRPIRAWENDKRPPAKRPAMFSSSSEGSPRITT